MELEYVRPLPPELLVEMHKCLPLDNQIYVLVNVSKTFVINNSTRMRRNIQRIKTSLNEYIGTLVNDGDGREELEIHKEIEWKSELDALLRYGNWLTSTREFRMHEDSGIIIGKTVEELLLHLTNSRSTQMTLNYVRILFGNGQLPIPTIIKTLFNKKDEYYLNGGRFLFESVELETEDGQILQIFDGEFEEYSSFTALKLFLMNKMEPNNLFRILIDVDSSEKFIQALMFSKWNMQSFDIANFIKEEGRVGNDQIEKNGNELEALSDISWDQNLDIFLRHGAGFTQFRHFTTKQYSILRHPRDYVDFLIDFISKTKHPEDFIESIEMNLRSISLYIEKIWEIFNCSSCVTKGEKFINFGGQKLHVLSAKIVESNSKLEFTLANGPANGAYLFDVEVKFGNEDERFKQIVGIKIQKRKNDGDIVELKCEDQIGQGKNEDEPTCSANLMKQ